MSNILKAVYNIVQDPILEIKDVYAGLNRANNVGDAFEEYIKDVFANSHAMTESEKDEAFSEHFSYLGNQNNPPDLMLKGGAAVEAKKVQGPNRALPLNSSYPKDRLYVDNSRITKACRNCEDWDVKDMIYAVGYITSSELKYIWLVYGDCIAAEKEVYERIKNTIEAGVNGIPDVEFTDTNELGKIKKVDPLGITDLRVRGMWHIDNPNSVFDYLKKDIKEGENFNLYCLMRSEKYDSFPEVDRNNLTAFSKNGYSVNDVGIKDPNNPVKKLECKLITLNI